MNSSVNTGLNLIERYNILILILMLLITALFHSLAITLGVLLGGLLTVINFYWLRRIIEKAFLKDQTRKNIFFVIYGLKFLLLLISVTLIIYIFQDKINIFAFLAGLSTVIFSIMLWAIKTKKAV